MHLHHHANITNNKMVFVSRKTSKTFRTIDCERPNDGLTEGRPFPFKMGPGQHFRILTSVNGLVCIGIRKNDLYAYYSDLILWNPATGDYKTLSKTGVDQKDCYRADERLFGLYHSLCDEDYKLLCVTSDPNPNVYIYSLKSDSWRKVESGFQCPRRKSNRVAYNCGSSVRLNENLYFLEHIFDGAYSIMRFNTKTETLKVIATPFSGDGKTTWLWTTWLGFTKRNDCIELWVNIENSLTSSSSTNELWRMDGDGDWTKVEISCTIMNDKIRYHHRLHLMRNGYLLGYDYDGDCVKKIDLKTNTQNVCSYIDEEMNVWPGGKYIETLVSPNQYTK